MKQLLSLLLALLAAKVAGAEVVVDADSAAAYVERCRKPNGAFGPLEQDYTDAAWNYPAVRTLQLLGRPIAQPEAILRHGAGGPPGHAGHGHVQFFHQHALRQALRGHPPGPPRPVKVIHQGYKPHYYYSPFGASSDLLYALPGGPDLHPLDLAGEQFSFHHLPSLHCLLAGLAASHRQTVDPEPLVAFILARQAPGGGFVDLRDPALAPSDAEAHVAHSWHALRSLEILGALPQLTAKKQAAAFLRGCRLENGGYRWNPAAGLPGNDADVYYAWAALDALSCLGESPVEPDRTKAWLNSLQNADGGFGDRPEWRSRLYATYYAVAALDRLGGLPGANIARKTLPQPAASPLAEDGRSVFQAQFKMPVPTADELAGLRERGFQLLALKTDRRDIADGLLRAIQLKSLPMDVILCPEAYPHRARHAGGALLDHVGNFTLDPRWSSTAWQAWQAADEAGAGRLPWQEYLRQVVAPLARQGSLAYPEQDYDEETALIAYGDDRSGTRGYNAVLAGFNWAPYDFVRVFPWRERYTERLTTVADVDAHGDLAKWLPHLDRARTLFIARTPTYVEFQAAAAAGRVVTVIAPAPGAASGSYYGPAPAVEYVRQRRGQWQWWP